MSEGVPVDSVISAVLQREAKVVVQVQHIHFIRVGQSAAVKVGFNHIIAQQRSLVLNLGRTAQETGRERGVSPEKRVEFGKTKHAWLVTVYLRHQESTFNPFS